MGLANENSLLDDRSFDAMIERGLADANAGRTISNYDMLRRIETWALEGRSQVKKSTSKHVRKEQRRMKTMIEPAAREQLIKVLDALPQEGFADVAQYADGVKRRYEKTSDPAKRKLLELYGAWRGEVGDEIAQVIEDGCEQVDPDGW